MEDNLKTLIEYFQQMHVACLNVSKLPLDKSTRDFNAGMSKAFEESARLINFVLNSENPNSVSNQPTEE